MTKDEAKAQIVALFDMSSEWTEEDVVLCLQYLDAIYRLHGGAGLKVVEDTEEPSDDPK